MEGKFDGIKSIVTIDKEKFANENKEGEMGGEGDMVDEENQENMGADESAVDTPITLLNQDGTKCGFKPVSVLEDELRRIDHAQF